MTLRDISKLIGLILMYDSALKFRFSRICVCAIELSVWCNGQTTFRFSRMFWLKLKCRVAVEIYCVLQLQIWLDNPKVELIYEMAIQNMADSQHLFPTYLQLSLHIHKYLEMHGYINFGIFKRIHPIRSKYDIKWFNHQKNVQECAMVMP